MIKLNHFDLTYLIILIYYLIDEIYYLIIFDYINIFDLTFFEGTMLNVPSIRNEKFRSRIMHASLQIFEQIKNAFVDFLLKINWSLCLRVLVSSLVNLHFLHNVRIEWLVIGHLKHLRDSKKLFLLLRYPSLKNRAR